MAYLYIQAVHIIGVVIWFAGLFYLGRLFVYHKEAEARPELERKVLLEQFALMEKRLWFAITWPGLCITVAFGIFMLFSIGMPGWIHAKLLLVVFLVAYHLYCGVLRTQLSEGRCRWTSKQLRMFNEVPSLLLVAIVFIVVLKDAFSWPILLGILALLGVSIMYTVKWYAKKRQQADAASASA
jgi:putative membrane protein